MPNLTGVLNIPDGEISCENNFVPDNAAIMGVGAG